MVRTGPMDYLRIRYGSIWEIQAQNLNLSLRSGVLRALLGQQELRVLKVRQVLREPLALRVLKVPQVQMVQMESQVPLARKDQQEQAGLME